MNAKMKRKLALAASVAVVIGALLYLILGNFQESLVYFYTPTEVAAKSAELRGKKIRLAGQVVTGSVEKSIDKRTMRFMISDGTHTTPVVFKGMAPDLFAEGQMAVAEGRPGDAVFEADAIMAKHSEDYDPKEVKYQHLKDVRAEKW